MFAVDSVRILLPVQSLYNQKRFRARDCVCTPPLIAWAYGNARLLSLKLNGRYDLVRLPHRNWVLIPELISCRVYRGVAVGAVYPTDLIIWYCHKSRINSISSILFSHCSKINTHLNCHINSNQYFNSIIKPHILPNNLTSQSQKSLHVSQVNLPARDSWMSSCSVLRL